MVFSSTLFLFYFLPGFLLLYFAVPARFKNAVALLANIGGVKDAEEAAALDLEGVGLFRTEFVFLSADKAPTVEEQTEIYRKVMAPFGDRRVVVRTLDAGADKPLAFADLGPDHRDEAARAVLSATLGLPLASQVVAEVVPATHTPIDSFGLPALRSFVESITG